MAGFKAAFANELFKLRKKKKLIGAVLLSILAVVVGQLAVSAVNIGFGLRLAGSAEFPLVVLPLFAYTILPLFATFVAIDMFSGEYAANTMKITLARPVSRLGVFGAKVMNAAAFILANLLFVMALSLAVGFAFNPSTADAAGIARVVLAYVVTFVPVFAFTLLVVLLSVWIRGGLAVFFLSVLLYVGFHFLSIALPEYSSFFITSMFDWYSLWTAESANGFKILRQLLLMAGYSIMLFAAGYYAFDRKDL